MKNIMLIILIALVTQSCHKEECTSKNNELTGKWLLTEQYFDPGNGSGDLEPVESQKTIIFFCDSLWISNGLLCEMNTASDEKSKGTYSLNPKMLHFNNCNLRKGASWFLINEEKLGISYGCFEACIHSYRKIR